MSITSLQEVASRASYEVQHASNEVKRFVHDHNPEQRERTQELNLLSEELHDTLGIDSLPLILNITVGEREYVSIRRKDFPTLPKEYTTESPDPMYRAKHIKVPANLIQEGCIGVIVLPNTWGAMPATPELKKLLEEDPEVIEGWDKVSMKNWLMPYVLQSLQMPYKSNEWVLGGEDGKSSKTIEVVKNIGGRYYTRGDYPSEMKDSKGYRMLMVREVKPDEEGNLWLARQDQFWCEEEIRAQDELNKKYGRFYVLAEGSSEREQNPAKLSSLKTAQSMQSV